EKWSDRHEMLFSQRGGCQPSRHDDCAAIPGASVGNLHYHSRLGNQAWFTYMSWADEKRCAPEPADNIRKTSLSGPADQGSRLAAGGARSNPHVPTRWRYL